MAYVSELGSGHRIYLDNQGNQTVITSMLGSVGQHQQSSSSVSTGSWTAPPEIYLTAQGAVLKITTAQGEHFIQVEGSCMSYMSSAPTLSKAQLMQVSQTTGSQAASSMLSMEPMQPLSTAQPIQPVSPMEPMQPMKMGVMEMGMNPMEMRMGNMHLGMSSMSTAGERSTPLTTQAKVRRFCSQCGAATEPLDRFCTSCGHKLT